MRLPSTTELLDVWEAGQRQPLLERSLHLLRVVLDVPDVADVARLSVGQRDACLLHLREGLFGRTLINKASCPACTETVEWETDSHDLHLQHPTAPPPDHLMQLAHDGLTVRFRLPNSLDLLRLRPSAEPELQSRQLLTDCVLSVEPTDAETNVPPQLPDSLWPLLNERMAEADPQADIQMQVRCPNCQHEWLTWFDILSYLWAEIDNWARHRLQEVFMLARGFGWSEREILQLSPQRRQTYLTMLRG